MSYDTGILGFSLPGLHTCHVYSSNANRRKSLKVVPCMYKLRCMRSLCMNRSISHVRVHLSGSRRFFPSQYPGVWHSKSGLLKKVLEYMVILEAGEGGGVLIPCHYFHEIEKCCPFSPWFISQGDFWFALEVVIEFLWCCILFHGLREFEYLYWL